MEISKKPKFYTTIFLLLTITITLMILPQSYARDPPVTTPTWTYIAVSLNPVGVGQQFLIYAWTNAIPPTQAVPWQYYIDIVKPNGDNETVGPFTGDTAGSGYTYYTADQLGIYKMKARFKGVTYPPGTPPVSLGVFQPPTDISNDTWAASESEWIDVLVQEEKRPSYVETPLPTDFWTRPVNAVNREWLTIMGNWLGTFYNAQSKGPTSNYAYGAGPESSHIMWSKPYWLGGIVDPRVGSGRSVDYYGGLVYETFGLWPPIVMNGRLYYNVYYPPRFGWYCVDLYTGETVYFHNTTGAYTQMGMMGTYPTGIEGERLAFGQILFYENPNMVGGFGYLWSHGSPSQGMHGGIGTGGSTWMMFDEFTGNYICSIGNVSTTGTWAMDTWGGIVRIGISGSGANQRLLIWNTTKTLQVTYGSGFYRPQNMTYDGNNGYSLNVTISPPLNSDLTTIRAIRVDDAIYGGSTGRNNENGVVQGVLWKMSLKKGEEGRILWNKTFTPPSSAGGLTISMGQVDPEDGAFFFECAQTRERWAYSMETMQQLWKSQPESQWNFYGMSEDIYEGKLITWGYGGELLAYNITTGKIVWNYTSLPVGLESWYGNTPISGALFCDDKIYIFSTEHSPSMPYRRDALIRCIDANTGKQLWNVTHWAINLAISDGYLVALNYYDNSVYCYGKGPSATTVTADPKVSVLGTKVLVEGTVTDQSPGGRQDSSGKLIVPLKGTPAIADEYMTPWMEYLFAQRPKPTDAKGVEVTIYVLDPNNNYYEVGKTTSDITGRFACDFTPEVPGKYQIIAKFDGSKSYGPSMATTYITVDETPPQSPSPTPATESLADTYFVPAVASILVAIIIVGAVTALLLLRKRP